MCVCVGGENHKLVSTDFSVYPPISYQDREIQIPSHPHQKITKHVLFLFFQFIKIMSPNCSVSGTKAELT